MIVGIDLLWVRPGVNGGGESYIRNLLDGFTKYSPDDINYVLFLSKDNHETFEKYFENKIFSKVICDINSSNPYKRILWENLNLDKFAAKCNIDLMFVPVYSKPLHKTNCCRYVITIHDLQAIYFPEYFSKIKNLWLRYSWKKCAQTSDKVVAISNYVKSDIVKYLSVDPAKVKVIYDPIIRSDKNIDFDTIKSKYHIEEKQYFYTVSSMLPHKNLKTLLYVVKNIKDKGLSLSNKLVISGVGGNSKAEILQLINNLGIEENIILTGFISNEERDCLYKNAGVFLFPSIFEGFGMPPIEAMMYGTPVVACGLPVIREVTENKAIYVEKYSDIDEWTKKIELACSSSAEKYSFEKYSLEKIAKEYINTFIEIMS